MDLLRGKCVLGNWSFRMIFQYIKWLSIDIDTGLHNHISQNLTCCVVIGSVNGFSPNPHQALGPDKTNEETKITRTFNYKKN